MIFCALDLRGSFIYVLIGALEFITVITLKMLEYVAVSHIHSLANYHHCFIQCTVGALQEITSQEMDKDKLFQEAMAEEADKGAQGVQKEDVMDQEEGTVTTDSEPAKDMLADNGASYSEMLRALKQILLEEK